jgi:ectoine hydroxylase-related dioxygenase (phytanoyl-CoA dioxygenase family)
MQNKPQEYLNFRTKDLAEFDRPITDLFPERTEFRLADEQVDLFNESGYLAPVDILDDAQIQMLRDELHRLMRPDQAGNPLFYEYHLNESVSGGVLFHALGAWRTSPSFHDLIFHPVIAAVAERLLGGPVRLWHDQLFVKPAHDGAVVAWHQDYSYWTRSIPMAHLTCWIALDDSTIENGCVHYVPGSHTWRLLPRTNLADDMEAILEVLDERETEQFRPVAIELKKGQASFHHPLMLHGSYANNSDRPRRGAVINMIRDGVRSDSDDPLLAGIPPVPKGDTIEGRYFPLLSI